MPTLTELISALILKNGGLYQQCKVIGQIAKDAPAERRSALSQLVHKELTQYVTTLDKGVSDLHTFVALSLSSVEWEEVEGVLDLVPEDGFDPYDEERRCR